MSGGGGGGRQMPMASNRGQQQQQQQMGQMAPRVGMMPKMGGNQTTPQNPAALFAPEVYQQPFGQSALGQMPPYQMSQQVSDQPMMGGQMDHQTMLDFFKNFNGQGGGMQPTMGGIGSLGVGQQVPMGGPEMFPYRPQVGDMPRGPQPMPQPIGTPAIRPPRFDGVGDGTGPGGRGLGSPINPPQDPRLGFDDFRKGDLPGRGMPPAYGPTKGPIDGRKLRDMMDIRTRRPIDGLPNALENSLPPSLKRPTQSRRG